MYLQLHSKISKLLDPDTDDAQLKRCAEEDWLSDANFAVAGGVLPLAQFHHSMFELADLWTEGMDPKRYAKFLAWVFEHTLRDGGDGSGSGTTEALTRAEVEQWAQLLDEPEGDSAASEGLKTEVRPSKIHGRGVFATAQIAKGDRVIEYKVCVCVSPLCTCSWQHRGMFTCALQLEL